MYIELFKQHFSAIDDHRQSAKVTYSLFDILFGSLCAVIASSNGWFEIREYILGSKNKKFSSMESLLTIPLLG
jgi:hypothetical protein